ncbi:MAG: PLD nuclease N-terminal domain-containing protein [Ruthenibacterium lactatiformans]
MLVFSRAGTVAYIILTLVSVLVVIAVIERDNINPAYKIMWLLIVVALPVTGAVFYRGATRASPPKTRANLQTSNGLRPPPWCRTMR